MLVRKDYMRASKAMIHKVESTPNIEAVSYTHLDVYKRQGLGAVNMDDSELLKEMVYKILNVDKIKK